MLWKDGKDFVAPVFSQEKFKELSRAVRDVPNI